jgi:hypothetical protein
VLKHTAKFKASLTRLDTIFETASVIYEKHANYVSSSALKARPKLACSETTGQQINRRFSAVGAAEYQQPYQTLRRSFRARISYLTRVLWCEPQANFRCAFGTKTHAPRIKQQ